MNFDDVALEAAAESTFKTLFKGALDPKWENMDASAKSEWINSAEKTIAAYFARLEADGLAKSARVDIYKNPDVPDVDEKWTARSYYIQHNSTIIRERSKP